MLTATHILILNFFKKRQREFAVNRMWKKGLCILTNTSVVSAKAIQFPNENEMVSEEPFQPPWQVMYF